MNLPWEPHAAPGRAASEDRGHVAPISVASDSFCVQTTCLSHSHIYTCSLTVTLGELFKTS